MNVKVSSIKESGFEPLSFAFMGRDAADHRGRDTFRRPDRRTCNAGRNRKDQRRSIPRSRRTIVAQVVVSQAVVGIIGVLGGPTSSVGARPRPPFTDDKEMS
jgi:hypothetical protein